MRLSLPRGAAYGLVGANGAGKTTLIKHILGLLRAQEGSVRVFGHDPVADPVAVLSRAGYLSEENDIPGWMRVEELVRYTRAFYPAWDDAYAEELRKMFALDPMAKVKSLSKGQRARAGLLIALAHRPELLVLDEPVLWLAAIDAIVMVALNYKASELVMLAILAPHVPLAYATARFAIARARRGDDPDWRSLFVRLGRITLLPGRREPFRSPARAQTWLEWRQHGGSLPALVGIVLPFALALLFIFRETPVLVSKC